jgi:hypothetical protein
MQYANIISLIDAYVERLLKVRRILAELNLPRSRRKVVTPTPNPTAQSKSAKRGNSRRKTSKSKVRKPYAKTMSVTLTEDRSASLTLTVVSGHQRKAIAPIEPATQGIEKSVSSGTIPVARFRTTQQSRETHEIQKRPVKPGTLALGGNIPTGPIVVPAEQIRYEQSLRQRESAIKARGSFQTPSDVPLTAELLARRWMQGANAAVTKTAL